MKLLAIVLHMGEGGLGVTRALGRMGVDVCGIDYRDDSVAFGSKYCQRKLVFANPILDPETCLDQFIRLGKTINGKAVLLPTADAYVMFVSKYESQLKDYFVFSIPAPAVLDSLVNKTKQYAVAEQSGVAVPKTFAPENMDSLRQIEDSLPYPVFIKGVNSAQWNAEFHNKGFVANDADELRKYFSIAARQEIPVLLQEIVVGPNRNHYKVCAYYSKNKELIALFCTQKTRQFPTDFGIGCYMTSEHNPILIEMGRRLFEGIGYTGVGSIEFKKDDKDGIYKLMELNPRFWQQNIQATCAGINFPYINYLDCSGETVEPCLSFKDNVRYLDIVPDILSFVGNQRRGDVSFLQWLQSILKADCFAYVSWNDIGPIWNYFKQMVKFVIRKISTTLGLPWFPLRRMR